MLHLKPHLDLLGLRVQDQVTGFTGVVANISFDLYGCIQAAVNPGLNSEGKLGETLWFDVSRLRIVDVVPVMKQPSFNFAESIPNGEKGPGEKPSFNKN